MGREIRMVPPNWEHPKIERPDYRTRRMVEAYQPLYDRPFGPAMEEWYSEWKKWEAGQRPDYCDEESKGLEYWEWSGSPPDPKFYRPDWTAEQMTWYQLFETVSEGTPVSPPFCTKQELADYLAANGDFWDQARAREGRNGGQEAPWGREAANRFVFGAGWAPSAMRVGGVIYTARDMPGD